MKYPKLPKKFKAKWVAALRSRKYIQGSEYTLSPNGHYCCLGVAEAVAGVPPTEGAHFVYSQKVPSCIRGTGGLANKLATLNDSGNWSFGKIATWIEKNL